jgi:hypothetical protein
LIKTATIADGASVSGEVLLEGTTITHMLIPASFEGTTVTFEVTLNGTTWYDLYNTNGVQVSITVASSQATILKPSDFVGILGFRITSGSAQTGAAVVQFVGRGL